MKAVATSVNCQPDVSRRIQIFDGAASPLTVTATKVAVTAGQPLTLIVN